MVYQYRRFKFERDFETILYCERMLALGILVALACYYHNPITWNFLSEIGFITLVMWHMKRLIRTIK